MVDGIIPNSSSAYDFWVQIFCRSMLEKVFISRKFAFAHETTQGYYLPENKIWLARFIYFFAIHEENNQIPRNQKTVHCFSQEYGASKSHYIIMIFAIEKAKFVISTIFKQTHLVYSGWWEKNH